MVLCEKKEPWSGRRQKAGSSTSSRFAASDVLTVNSSPYAAKIYRKLGFVDTDTEQVTNGIRYVPMKYTVGRNDE